MGLPNGFDGVWNPICPDCGGYMHTDHTPDCPVTIEQERSNAELVALLKSARFRSQVKDSST